MGTLGEGVVNPGYMLQTSTTGGLRKVTLPNQIKIGATSNYDVDKKDKIQIKKLKKN